MCHLHDQHGWELPDPKPVQIPAGLRKPPTIHEQIQRIIKQQLSDQAAAKGRETFEESDDFDVDDDPDIKSPYELDDNQEKATMMPEYPSPKSAPEVKEKGVVKEKPSPAPATEKPTDESAQ